jgi:ATP-dependent RNA helicase MSS116
MGFSQDISRILSYLPDKSKRQTLLFSATIPKSVEQMIELTIKRNHAHIDCIQDDDPLSHTHKYIDQSYVVLPKDKLISGVVQIVTELMKEPNHKILVFFATTAQVKYFSSLFNQGLGRPVFEIHSKKDQNARSNTSERFRRSKEAVMFTSDVSARGVDYPGMCVALLWLFSAVSCFAKEGY